MRKTIYILATLMVAFFAGQFRADAVLPITKVGMVMPNDMVYIDMATTAAKNSVAAGLKPEGAVIVKNAQMLAQTGATESSSAIKNAIAKVGDSAISGSLVYTVNQPAIDDLVALSKLGAKTIYFVNDQGSVVAANLYPAEAYSEASIPAGLTITPLVQLEYPDAQNLIEK